MDSSNTDAQGAGENALTFRIGISGLVQGVGFRPFVFRLAESHQLKGWVENRNDGVVVMVSGTRRQIEGFRDDLLGRAPRAASIESLELCEVAHKTFDTFTIRESSDVSDSVTEISPDIAVCEECLADMKIQEHRLNYPLINCTHCGPRLSIIFELPYDRQRTTMAPFPMCPACQSEFNNVYDRRFHAQPVACNHCGPVYSLTSSDGEVAKLDRLLGTIRKVLSAGGVLAIKGTGGFHLVCDALSMEGIKKMREVKRRDGKPFALMFRDLEQAREWVDISETEEELLTSWRRPIVLLRKHKEITRGIADGLSTLGIMLPYMPFHYLMFESLDTPALVMTSGNFTDEPILISNEEASVRLGEKVEGIVVYNREIHNRVDDSVTAVFREAPVVFRRARGYAPSPVRTNLELEGILGTGAEKTSSFCMGKGSQALMSQYAGDLSQVENYDFYREIYERFSRLFRFTPRMVVSDLHPDYLSSRFARQLLDENPGSTHLSVQHHHAHIASVMLDRGLDGEVIGFSFDGTGLGTDGRSWGGEVMRAGFQGFDRLFHFGYLPLPGGDRAVNEPWRMAISYLYDCYGEGLTDLKLPLLEHVDRNSVGTLIQMIDSHINSPLVSSAGRLFDAVSAIAGLNYHSTYQAQAPMLLESAIDGTEKGCYPFEIEGKEISFRPMIRQIVEEVQEGAGPGKIATRFHHTIANMVLDTALQVRNDCGLDRVVLGGGTFQNRYLTEKVIDKLENEKFEVYLPFRLPVNDQGIAAGQVAIGAYRMKQ